MKAEGQGELIFVYGTLREGGSKHDRMEGAKRLGEAWVLGRLYEIAWHPGMLLDESEGIPVRGEVFEIERAMLRPLDEFEGNEFERLKTTVHLKEGGEVRAWIYEYRGAVEGKRELVPADWMKREESPERSRSIFSLLTFLLLPLAAVAGVLTLNVEVSGPAWASGLFQGFCAALPLLPFLTSRHARKREERWAEGAEIFGALALIFFAAMFGVRFVPVVFEAFPN